MQMRYDSVQSCDARSVDVRKTFYSRVNMGERFSDFRHTVRNRTDRHSFECYVFQRGSEFIRAMPPAKIYANDPDPVRSITPMR